MGTLCFQKGAQNSINSIRPRWCCLRRLLVGAFIVWILGWGNSTWDQEAMVPKCGVEGIANDYAISKLGWKKGDYTVVFHAPTEAGIAAHIFVVDLIHVDDQVSETPGAGKSVQLWIDKRIMAIEKVMHFQ